MSSLADLCPRSWVGAIPAGVVATSLCAAMPLGRAQDPAEIAYDISVMQRPVVARGPSYARLGAWLVTPSVDITRVYDGNIYATERNTQADSFTSFRPRVELESDWNRHSVALDIGGDVGLYDQFSAEDYRDYYFVNRTRLDILAANRIDFGLRYRHAHTPRTSSEDIGAAAEPLRFEQRAVNLGFKREVGIITLALDTELERITYARSDAVGGGIIDNSDRDRTQLETGVTLGYEPSDEGTAYFRAGLRGIDYDNPTQTGGYDRDSTGLDLQLGAERVFSDLWVLDAYFGYAPRFFSDPGLANITDEKALTFGGELLWNPTALTSIIATAKRRTYETAETDASGNVNTFFAINLQHQLLRSLILNGGLEYSHSNFSGTERKDDDYGLGFGLEYSLMRMVSVRADYRFRERDSTLSTADYEKHLAEIGVRLSF